ncbi:MAG: S1/P1 nuclease [Acidobacteriota bacterium]|nr:S1/P1 nuclease [Acidobacteriota bacterium]
MRLLRFITAILILAFPAAAWNYSGHRIIAEIAYRRLTPQARLRVDEMMRRHPDFDMLARDAPAGANARAHYAFVWAASWPDQILSDSRFYDADRADSPATPLLPGFPDMQRHRTWHYYDIPISGDGTPALPQPPPHLMTELPRLISELTAVSPEQAAYDLPWLVHLVGDSHQPLHATSRYLRSQPNGDAGGNFVFVQGGTNLHALWDNAAAPRDVSYEQVIRYAREIAAENPQAIKSLDPKDWTAESLELDKSAVYTFGLENGTREHPLILPRRYEQKAKFAAKRRVALAGFRLAALLNRLLL